MQRRTWAACAAATVLVLPLAASAQAVGGGSGGSPQQATQAAAPQEAVPNDDPSFLQVYDANVENLPTSAETCAGDWHDLLYYMRLQDYRPDVYLVQQVGGQDQLETLLQRMEEHFGEEYEGVVAEADPEPSTAGECGEEKYVQTNAVVWRADRLSLSLSEPPENRWQAQTSSGGECVNNDQARTKGVKAILHDKVADRDVTAASFHWPTSNAGHTAACAVSNAGELSNELTEDGYDASDLAVAGGDANWSVHAANEPTTWTGWYQRANGDLGGAHGFRDPVYEKCTAEADPESCFAASWSFNNTRERRIDVMLTRKADGTMPTTSDTVVPDFDEADEADIALTGDDRTDLDYSDHRAVGSRIHY